MKTRLPAAAVLCALFFAGCGGPKYNRHYVSVFKDFTVWAPWGWDVGADAQGKAFTEVRFVGPFDGDFFQGAPSLSVRWYRPHYAHQLRDGSMELYSSADDFIAQTLRGVYGFRPGKDDGLVKLFGLEYPNDGGRQVLSALSEIPTIPLHDSGLEAKYFVVRSPAPAPPNYRWGVDVNPKNGKPYNVRMHAYAVVSMPNGFYVLCYPATERGFRHYEDRFRAMLNTFKPLTSGPAGAKLSRKPAALAPS